MKQTLSSAPTFLNTRFFARLSWPNSIWAPSTLTLLSGILIVLAFPPWDLWPLAWICFIPWLSVLKKCKTTKEAFIQGLWFSIFMSWGCFYWVSYVLTEFGGVHWSLSYVGLMIFSLFGQPQFHLFSVFLHNLAPSKKPLQSAGKTLAVTFLVALAYAGLDWILPKLFIDTLGHSFYRATHLRQLADLGGASFLTFLAFLVNWTLWQSWERWKKEKFSTPSHYAPAMVVFLFCSLGWTYGYFRNHQVSDHVSKSNLGFQAAAIQGNIGDFDKVAAERGAAGAADKVIRTFTELTDQALQLQPKPEVVIWPETSYPSTFRNPHSMTEASLDHAVESYAQKIGIPLLFGGYDHMNSRDFNAFFFLSPGGHLQTYRKNILLLFGEYIPGAEQFQFIKDTFPQVGNFGRGKGPEVLNINTSNPNIGTVRAAPIICYEALFPNYVIESARHGSQVIVNITNDSWFGTFAEPQLHLALTVFRSIETRLPMIRATNTGISALITSTGEITHPTQNGEKTIMNAFVPLYSPIDTLMKRWGDWFGIFAFGFGFSGLLIMEGYSRNRKKRE